MNRRLLTIFFLSVFGILSLQPEYAHATEKKFLIGLIPEMNIFKQKQRFTSLGEYLSKRTGLDIKFTILSRYGNIIESFENEKMDAAFFGSFTGAAAVYKLGVVPIARPVNPDGASTYKGYLFVRKDSNITDIKGMKGKKMAFVEKATTAGYVFPLAYLRENGISSPNGFFREYYFAGSHDAAIDAVLNRKADVGAAKNTIYERMRKENPRLDKELVILAESQAVPSNGLCVRKNLEDSVKKKLKDTLLAMHNDPEGQAVLKQFGALKFIETSAKDYEPVHELAQKAGIDLKKYKWRNE
ncbi:MAG: phosphate/phosphite/phosphonate ABC transporter substrate-binding protein [Nitrospirae bacterium]|nr:phosphate/phosphite/phosphonate ABC transporter substrate-binding protein [Nitrospirota bacterium]